MTGGCKGEINPLLEVVIGGTDEILELRGTRDESMRQFGVGGLAESVSINDLLDFVKCR